MSKVVDEEVYSAPKNAQALIEEQEVSVAKVVDEVSKWLKLTVKWHLSLP